MSKKLHRHGAGRDSFRAVCSLGIPTPADEWPMWGGTADRNMVSNMKGIPTTWDVKTKKNIKWVVELGSQSYGNPVVAGGMVFVGTNNESARDPSSRRPRRADGIPRSRTASSCGSRPTKSSTSGRANDWPFQGVVLVAARRGR